MPKRGKQGRDITRLRTGQVDPGSGEDTGGEEFPGIPDLGTGPRPPAGGGGLPAISITNIATATAIAINEQGEGDVGDVTATPPPPGGGGDDGGGGDHHHHHHHPPGGGGGGQHPHPHPHPGGYQGGGGYVSSPPARNTGGYSSGVGGGPAGHPHPVSGPRPRRRGGF